MGGGHFLPMQYATHFKYMTAYPGAYARPPAPPDGYPWLAVLAMSPTRSGSLLKRLAARLCKVMHGLDM
jgi:hypothetical protein